MYNKIEKRLVLLEFKRPELLYDLQNLGYIITDSLPQQNAGERHNLTDIGEDGNVDRVTRMMDLAYADVLRFLSGYVIQDLDQDTFGHDVLLEKDSYFIILGINAKTPDSAVGVLRTYVHEYIVSFVMEDWTSIVSPDIEPVWAKKKEDLEAKIKGCLAYQHRGVRVMPHPFP